MDILRLSDFLSGAASKRLSATEVDPQTSHGHEFQGSAPLRALLGTEDREFRCRYVFLSDGATEPFVDVGRLTWYDARAKNPNRSAEFRGYFRTELIWERARPGDLLVLATIRTGELVAIIAEQSSGWQHFLEWLLGVPRLEQPSAWSSADTSRAVDFVLAADLADALGLEMPASTIQPLEEAARQVLDREHGMQLWELLDLPTREVSRISRTVARATQPEVQPDDPDEALMLWMNTEEQLFRLAEKERHGEQVRRGFNDIEEFIDTALSILNTRKSRAGHALENHFAEILHWHDIPFDAQATTEGRSKPDFLMPGASEYHDPGFPTNRLLMVAAKRTCKDRWRQILTEADRIPVKHLLTLQSPISEHQVDEMIANGVRLIVPRSLHGAYSPSTGSLLETVGWFVDEVHELY